jgi:hypothetical protein
MHGYCASTAASDQLDIGRRGNGTKRPWVGWDRAGGIVICDRERHTNEEW